MGDFHFARVFSEGAGEAVEKGSFRFRRGKELLNEFSQTGTSIIMMIIVGKWWRVDISCNAFVQDAG